MVSPLQMYQMVNEQDSISSTFVYARVFQTKFWRQSQNVTRKSCRKNARNVRKNVDEIDTRRGGT